MDLNLNEAIRWVVSHGLTLLIGGAVILLFARLARPAIHRIVPGVLHAQAATLAKGAAPADEVDKRAATVEDLLNTLLRVAVWAGMVALVLAVFDLWSVLAGMVLIIAAITVASQDIVLDYAMGFLILVEGPYFKGDWISVGGQPGSVQGEVQEIGLRRTILRDTTGAVNSVSNGLIRMSSNATRVFSVAVVEFQILNVGQLDRAIAVAGQVNRELHADPEWSDRLLVDATTDVWVTALTIDGATLRIQQRVAPDARMAVASEARRRLAAALAAASIGTARWDTPLPIANETPRERRSAGILADQPGTAV